MFLETLNINFSRLDINIFFYIGIVLSCFNVHVICFKNYNFNKINFGKKKRNLLVTYFVLKVSGNFVIV